MSNSQTPSSSGSDTIRAGTKKASAVKRERVVAKRVFLVEDHEVIREAMTHLLDNQKWLTVCGGTDDPQAALKEIADLRPDLVISDISLPTGDGIELLKEIRSRHPLLPVLMLSMFDDTTYAERAIRAGANGYVMKQSGSEELLNAIRTVFRDEVHVSGPVMATLLRKLSGARPANSEVQRVDNLTDRELQVLRLIGDGLRVKEIAEQLFVSPKTVESHRENMKRKLKIDSSAELLRYAISHSRVGG